MEPVTVSIILATFGWLVSTVISKTVSETWESYTKHVGLDEESKSLIAVLTKIMLLLEAAQSMQLSSNKMHLLQYLKDVKCLTYEAQNLLDELDYFRLQKEVKRMNRAELPIKRGPVVPKLKNKSLSHQPGSPMPDCGSTKLKLDKKGMSCKIKALVKELQQRYDVLHDVLKFEQREAIQPATKNPKPPNRPPTTSYSHETNIYGRDKEIDHILKLIGDGRPGDQRVPVIAIVGQGGIGKTTLAQQVYKDQRIKTYFDKRIWICVSTGFDETEITRQMLECANSSISYAGDSNLDNLKHTLENHFKGKKILLVLDDIWEIKSNWYSVLTPLNPCISMVLVTTRDPFIAKMVSKTDLINLDGLDENYFWSLFKNCVFGNDQYEVPDSLENIGRDIAKRLGGNPLAVKTVGNLLKNKNDALQWMEILESEQWKSQKGTDDIMPTLRLSYEYLPIHLQQCFSYCSLFPKNYNFTAEELVYIWMVQGFLHIDNDHKKRVEDVGFEYLNSLVKRGFFQTIVIKNNSHPRYVIYDLMHDLAQIVSMKECLAINHTPHISPPPGLRHLSILHGEGLCMKDSVEFQNLISLIIFKGIYQLCNDIEWDFFGYFELDDYLDPHLLKKICDQANKVRLLIISPYSLSCNLTNFIHLRYLGLYFDEYSPNFPVEICRLYHLEVLELRIIYAWSELPKEFNNLINLRHFIAPEDLHSKIAGVGKLKLLQELKAFEVHKEENDFELEQLGGLKELRGSLEILNLENVKCREEAQNAKLSEKEVVTLKLSWSKNKSNANHVSQEDILEVLQPNNKLRKLCIKNYGGCKSPSWLANHLVKYLEDINLSHCEAWEELPNFGQLRFLKELRLSYMPKVKTFDQKFHGCSSQRGFPSLKLMEVSFMYELETWVWSEQCEVFPSLESLTIKTCPKLTELSFSNPAFHDEGMKWFFKLSNLQITDCPQLEQIPPIPCSRSMSQAHIERVGSIELIKYVERQKLIARFSFDWNQSNSLKLEKEYLLKLGTLETTKLHVPRTMDQVFIFKNFRNIKLMHVIKCPYLITSLSWKGICLLDCLESLWIEECPKLLLSLEEDEDDGKNFYSQKSLQYLEIHSCGVTGEGLSWLLARLPAVSELSICHCPDITFVKVPRIIDEPNSSRSRISSLGAGGKDGESLQHGSGSLMSLEVLKLVDCPKMFFVNEEGLSGLTTLKRIKICDCGKLLSSMSLKEQADSIDWLPWNIEHLELDNVSAKMARSLADLPSLHNLAIWKSPNLTVLDLYSFVALKQLVLHDCKELTLLKGPKSLDCKELFLIVYTCPILVSAWNSASGELDQDFLSSVRKLCIDDIGILSLRSSKFLKALQSLTIVSDEKAVMWTEKQEEALLLLTALEKLRLAGLKNLGSLPVELYLYPSLKKLSIEGCPEIKSLPQKGFPKSLQELRLSRNCSKELKSRCSQIEYFEYNETHSEYVFVKKGSSVNWHC